MDRALDAGHDAIVAVGGDGTWSRVADRILRSGRRDVALGLLAGGTGNDFGKSVGVTFERSEEVVRAIAAGRRKRIDVGRVGERHFLNVVGFGFDIAVIDDAAGVPVLKGDLLYRFSAARQLFRFPGLELDIRVGSVTVDWGDGSDDVYFNRSRLDGRLQLDDLREGDEVQFQVKPGDKGPQAIGVKLR